MAQAALVGLALLSAGGSIYSGFSAMKSAKEEANQLQDQAALARAEAQTEADRKSEERRKFIANQKVAYLSNGVGISAGTAHVTFADTFNQYQREIDATLRAGRARGAYLDKEAKITRRNGKAAFISGITQAAGTLATTGLASGFGKGAPAPKHGFSTTGSSPAGRGMGAY